MILTECVHTNHGLSQPQTWTRIGSLSQEGNAMFGCGEGVGGGRFHLNPDAAEAAFQPRADRLRHMDQLNQAMLDPGSSTEPESRASSTSPTPARVHTVPSGPETVHLGVFDSTLPNVLEIESGDVVVYPNTWTHFLNRVQPGVSIAELAQWRRDNPDRGPHSIIGPIGVRDAEPGD